MLNLTKELIVCRRQQVRWMQWLYSPVHAGSTRTSGETGAAQLSPVSLSNVPSANVQHASHIHVALLATSEREEREVRGGRGRCCCRVLRGESESAHQHHALVERQHAWCLWGGVDWFKGRPNQEHRILTLRPKHQLVASKLALRPLTAKTMRAL